MNKVAVPLLIMATGAGWLLSSNGVMAGVDWAWVLFLGMAGIIYLINGLTKVSIVVGPLLLLGSVLVVLMQTDRINVETIVPVMVITLGALLLVSRISSLPDGISKPPSDDNPSED